MIIHLSRHATVVNFFSSIKKYLIKHQIYKMYSSRQKAEFLGEIRRKKNLIMVIFLGIHYKM